MRLEWKYGRSTIRFEVPDVNIASVLQPKQLGAVPNETKAIDDAIKNPIGSEPLCKIAAKGSKIAILVSDITRPCPSYKILPPLVAELLNFGVEESNITIFFATGMHRGHTADEQKTLVGQKIANRFRLIDHNCKDEDNLLPVGKTQRGTKVSINRNVLDSDLRIGVANLDVHYFAGYSGGAKSLVPGVAGFDTIRQNHSLMLLPKAEAGVADGNPVREDLEEAADMAGLDFIVNLILNDNKEIVHVVAGNYVKAHRAGIPPNDHMYKVSTPERGDIVVATAGGYPKDINLYQAQKALDNAAYAVKDGGTIVLLADCREGLGEKTFESWLMDANSPDDVIRRLEEDFMLGGHKAFAIARLAKKAEIVLVSSLQPKVVRRAFMTPARSVSQALDKAFSSQGRDATIVLMPYAGSTLPCPSG